MSKNIKKAFSLIEIGVILLIIAIIFGAINEGTNLYRKSKLASARNLTDNSPLNYYEGLAVWLETTSQRSFDREEPGNGDVIENWHSVNPRDLSKFTVSQPNVANRPIYDSSAINGKPALKFDGDNDFLYKEGIFRSELADSQNVTFFVVQIHDSSDTTTTTFRWHSGTAASPSNNVFGIHAPDETNFHFDYGLAGEVDRITQSSLTNFSDTPKIIAVKKNGSNVSIRFDGAEVLTSAAISDVLPEEVGVLAVGQTVADGSGTYLHNGWLGELIIFNRTLTDDEVNAIERYLSKKWDIKI